MGVMPRPKRIALGGYVYHVLNRTNGRLRIFCKDSDFLEFERILGDGAALFALRRCGYCLLGNHWHLLLWPREDDDLSRFMRWVTLTHTQRYHTSHATVGIGHLYQGRYKSFPVQSDRDYQKPGQWAWSTFAVRAGRESEIVLRAEPVKLPPNWARLVQAPLSPAEISAIGTSIGRGAPFGTAPWVTATATRLQLQSTLQPRGRPGKCT